MANTEIKIGIEVESKSINQLEEELKEVNEQLAKVPLASDDFKTLSKESQQLTKELNKANEAAEGFTSEDKFQAADGAIKVMAGSLAGVVGTLGVLGVESEAFGEFEEKAASAIAVAIGFKDISEGIGQLGPLLGKASTAVKAFGSTTRLALIATGIGAFVVAIGSIVVFWDDITKAVNKFGESVPFVGKALEGIKGAFNAIFDAARPVLEFLGILPDEAERAIIATTEANEEAIKTQTRALALARARGASAEELFKIQEDILKKELENLKNAEAEKQEIYDKETELLVLQAAEKKRIAEENAQTVQRETVATVSSIKAIGIAQVGTSEIVAKTLDAETLATKRKVDADKASADAARAAAEAEELRTARLSEVSNTLMNLGSVLDQESAAGKALAISSAIINTYLGVTEALKQESTLPSPFDVIAKVANVATILATGFKAVQAIKSTPTRSASGGAPRGGIAAGAPGAPTGRIGDVAGLPQGNLNTAPQNTVTQPTVQAYVLSGNVTSAQEADAKLSTRRNIG